VLDYRKPDLGPEKDRGERSKPQAVLAGLVAAACLAGIALVVYKWLLTDQWTLLDGGILLVALIPIYAWSLYLMFLHASGDRKAAKRRTVIAIGVTAAATAAVVLVPQLLAGLGFGLGGGGGSDNDSDSDDSGESTGGFGSGWHFGGVGPNAGGSGEAPHYGSPPGQSPGRGGLCPGCGRRWASPGELCAACSMPRF
jgi:hypothetical protein